MSVMATAQDSVLSGQQAALNNNDCNNRQVGNENVASSNPREASSATEPSVSAASLAGRPLILITDSNPGSSPKPHQQCQHQPLQLYDQNQDDLGEQQQRDQQQQLVHEREQAEESGPVGRKVDEEQVEEVDGISYRIVAAVTKPASGHQTSGQRRRGQTSVASNVADSLDDGKRAQVRGTQSKVFGSMRRKSSAFVANLLRSGNHLGPTDGGASGAGNAGSNQPQRRLSIYEMTKSPPPETSLEIYLSERRRSSTISSKQVQQQLEQQSTFETNYCQRQQYFKDLNQKLINHDKKLLNVVANRGQMHRHSVDIAQLALHLAQAKGAGSRGGFTEPLTEDEQQRLELGQQEGPQSSQLPDADNQHRDQDQDRVVPINQGVKQEPPRIGPRRRKTTETQSGDSDDPDEGLQGGRALVRQKLPPLQARNHSRRSFFAAQRGSITSSRRGSKKSRIVIRKFQKLDQSVLSSTPAPDVKIGQRVAYKEYYGNEFGTIRWIGRVPQICPDWTAGVEFDNAIGEGDGSLNGRRYFIAKDCFAKFLPLNAVAFVDQHVGRPEPGTMISVMSAAVRPGQMISIQRVSTVHVQHCFLNAPHQRPGADILAVNTRLHCQCPNCGPCAHVIKPPRTQRIARAGKNATHMCQFSTYTCCGMESQEETMCTYMGNKVISLPPPPSASSFGLPPIGNSWIEGAGYLSSLQAQQSRLMPEEYRLGAAPEDIVNPEFRRRLASHSSSRRGSAKQHKSGRQTAKSPQINFDLSPTQIDHNDSWTRMMESASPDKSRDIASPMLVDDKINASRPVYSESVSMNYLPSHAAPTNLEVDSRVVDEIKLAVMNPDKQTFPNQDLSWREDNSNNNNTDSKPGTKGAKIVYRDSIENRYLFPTDDPIDSTLEADLENLSQARYGHSTNSRLSGSRNILRSLRSLVSCLGAQSASDHGNRPKDMFERGHPERGKIEYSDIETPTLYYTNENKSVPALVASGDCNKSNTMSCCTTRSDTATALEKEHEELLKTTTTTTAIDYYAHSSHRPFVDSQGGDEKRKNHHQQHHHHHHRHHHHHHRNRRLSRKGQDQCQQCNDQLPVRRHISSSSDCGFSSASQNSVNFQSSHQTCNSAMSAGDLQQTNQIYKRIVTRLMMGPSGSSITSGDLLRLRRILFEPHVGNCCLHAKGSDVTKNIAASFDYSESDEIIADIIHKSHLWQARDDGIKNYEPKECCEIVTNCCLPSSAPGLKDAQMNHEQSQAISISNLSTVKCAEKMAQGNDGEFKGNHHNSVAMQLNPSLNANLAYKSLPRSLIGGSSTSDSIILSSYDSLCGAVIVGGDNESYTSNQSEVAKRQDEKSKDRVSDDVKASNCAITNALPKAFELKLTLSINSDANKDLEGSVKSFNVNHETPNNQGFDDQSNSTININIVSSEIRGELKDTEINKTGIKTDQIEDAQVQSV